jgi:2-polyprenyl-3-methyl-5-hydroxy-6-metoxy-1,4-benzoquinol methylase
MGEEISMTTNADLRDLYEAGYAAGNTWHTPVDTWEESLLIHKMGGDWRGKTVLEIGCGEGRLAALIAASEAYQVSAIDYSSAAISTAISRYSLPNLLYASCDLADVENCYDVVVMQGVLEHSDYPWLDLVSLLKMLSPSGHIITSSPSFLNPRGYVWQTLRLLFNVPMSLSDLHAINPWEMQAWCDQHGLPLHYESCHHDWGHGQVLKADYAHRLPKALADAGMDASRVDTLLAWLEQAGQYEQPTEWNGATIVYKIGPKP